MNNTRPLVLFNLCYIPSIVCILYCVLTEDINKYQYAAFGVQFNVVDKQCVWILLAMSKTPYVQSNIINTHKGPNFSCIMQGDMKTNFEIIRQLY